MSHLEQWERFVQGWHAIFERAVQELRPWRRVAQLCTICELETSRPGAPCDLCYVELGEGG